MSAKLVDKLGFISFLVMSTLILFCIVIGIFAVHQQWKRPTWEQICIEKGGVPIRLEKYSYDCKY